MFSQSPLEPVHRQIGAVASGTIAAMTGLNRYEDIDALRDTWQQWAINRTDAKTWQESWEHYQKYNNWLVTLIDKHTKDISTLESIKLNKQDLLTPSELVMLNSRIESHTNHITRLRKKSFNFI